MRNVFINCLNGCASTFRPLTKGICPDGNALWTELMVQFDEGLRRYLGRFRNQGTSNVPASVLLGWYLRKGFFPGLRGLLKTPFLRSAGSPLFVGRGVRLSYPSKVVVGSSCAIGANVIINAFSVEGVVLGDRVTIRENGWIQCSSHPSNPGVGLAIGSNTYIGPSVILGVGGKLAIGKDCQIGAGCTFISENHQVDEDGVASASEVERIGITIGDGCWIGHRASILDGVILGENCIVGAGAVVTRSFPAGSKIAGVPARAL